MDYISALSFLQHLRKASLFCMFSPDQKTALLQVNWYLHILFGTLSNLEFWLYVFLLEVISSKISGIDFQATVWQESPTPGCGPLSGLELFRTEPWKWCEQWASTCVRTPFVWAVCTPAHHLCKWSCACLPPLTQNHPPLPHRSAKPEG